MKIKPTNTPVTRKSAIDPIACVRGDKPSEISDEDWDLAKAWAQSRPDRIPSDIRELAYRRFYQQYTFEDIATKFDLDVGCVVFTAIHDDWFTRIKKEKRVRGSDGVERLDKDMRDILTDIVQGMSAAYTHQLHEVMLDPSKAASCNLIPKNLKEVQLLFTLIQSLQSKDVPTEQKSITPSVTNVNVQNLIAGSSNAQGLSVNPMKELSTIDAKRSLASEPVRSSIPYEDDIDEEGNDESDSNEFDLLLRAKGGSTQ